VDERATAFMALGYGRATGKAAGWITTSGTALANGYPAVIEASMEAVPMLLLTADRPPELRDTDANQTIR
ncbi:MAG: thiamine pyrophosphate-binding protein, partial [Rhodothermales bacterium]